MNINKLFLRLIIFFGLMMVPISGWGLVLDTDTFNTDKDGWGGSGESWDAGGQRLFINRGQTGTKTYSFGAGYSNQLVTVSLDATKTTTWEVADLIQITANGTTVYSSNVGGSISFNATLNGSGQLALVVTPNTSNNDEDMYIDNVVINYTPVPEINVQGNGITITDGDGGPGVADNTDFGTATINGSTIDKTFTIQNLGTANLDITNMTLSGTNASDFSIASSPALPFSITPGSSSSITVRFTTPATTGQRDASLNITSNDTDEGTYNFSIKGYSESPDNSNGCPSTTELLLNSTTTGLAINPVADVDYFKVVVPEYGLLRTTLTNVSFSQIEGALYNSSCTLIPTGSMSVNGDYVFGDYVEAGTYYLMARDRDNNETQQYSLMTEFIPMVKIAISDASKIEGNTSSSPMTFHLTLERASTSNVTVQYRTNNITATAGSDYTGVTSWTTVTFLPGETSKDINISISGDTTLEADETFSIDLQSASSNAHISDNQGIGTILNDEMPTVSINDVSIFEGPDGSTRLMTFTVSIFSTASGTIDYSTSNVTASAGSDYEAKSGTITFVAGEITQREIEVKIFGDTNSSEGTETFNVILSNPVGFTINRGTGIGTIYDYGSTLFRSGERDFELRNPQKTRNKTGDILTIGNTVQCVTDLNNAFNGTCTTNLDRTANSYYTKYLNSDTNTSTFNSANATLAGIPADATVIWAGLYWEGFLHKCDSTNSTQCHYRYSNNVAPSPTVSVSSDDLDLSSNSLNAQTIYIDIPNNTVNGYEQVTASLLDYRYISGANGTVYSAFVEITELLNKTNANGIYTVANIQSMEGLRGYGNFGAWSLFVIYEDLNPTATLRNMSVYDGFKTVSQTSSASIPLSGFMTPTQGVVDSKLISFAGEGEHAYSPDRISVGVGNYVSNTENPDDNVFNSTIAGFTHNPSYDNANGIDIDIFNVSSFMGNGQTSTTVNITSGQDAFYPSVIGFSTQLYAPDVCYLEDIYYNGNLVSDSNVPESGKDVVVEVMVTNKDNEPAQGVFIEKNFENTTAQLEYKPGSMSIRQIGSSVFNPKTDIINDDTAEYEAPTLKVLLGVGASGAAGGTIAKDTNTSFRYTATIGTDSDINENVYRVSYRNDYLRINFQGVPIRKCQNFNNAFGAYTPVIGNFNTVRRNAVLDSNDPVDPNDAKNALYTQIVNKAVDVDVLSFSADNITVHAPTANMDVNLSIVELDSDNNCTSNYLSATQMVNFTTSTPLKQATVTPTKASRNAAFRMSSGGTTICSRDRFAVRPAGFSIDSNETVLKAGKNYNFTFKGIQYGNTSASLNYNQSMDNTNPLDKNGTTQLVIPAGCPIVDIGEQLFNAPGAYNLSFSDGTVSAAVKYPDVGEVRFTLNDNEWTASSDDQIKGDCIVGSESNTAVGGKYGCNVKSTQNFTFIPDHFVINTTFMNSGNGYTYMAPTANLNDIAMELNLTVTAQNFSNVTTTNYQTSCFAKDTNLTVTFDPLVINPSGGITQLDFSEDLTAVNGSNDPIGTQFAVNNLDDVNLFTTANPGVANPVVRFNLNRNPSIPVSPVLFNVTNINIVDTDGATGNDTIDRNSTFLYGRADAPDYRFSNTSGCGRVWFEFYDSNVSDPIATSLFGNLSTIRTESSDANWYKNNFHNFELDGNITATTDIHMTLNLPVNFAAVAVGCNASSSLGNEKLGITYDGAYGYPYRGNVELDASDWLDVNNNDFGIEFYKSSGWIGTTDKAKTATDSNVENISNRRIMW